jgi:hypothetical protein
MAFYELRQYKVLPGKLDEWVRIMEEEIIPFQVSKGMVICGSFRGETDESVYVWIRRFESEEQRVALYKEVYESDYWKTKIAPRAVTASDRCSNRCLLRRQDEVARGPVAHDVGCRSVRGGALQVLVVADPEDAARVPPEWRLDDACVARRCLEHSLLRPMARTRKLPRRVPKMFSAAEVRPAIGHLPADSNRLCELCVFPFLCD